MNCRDAARLIDYFFDGELDGHVMRDAALHITRCPSCEGELHDRERAQGLLTESINRELDQIDLSVIWTAIDRELASSRTERNGLRLAVPQGAGSETWPAAEQWSASSVPAPGPLGRRWSPVGASLTFGGLVALAASIAVAVTMLGHGPKPEQTVSVATAPHTSANQVRIESMDYPGSSVAMWSEPEDDTMVIWIEDDEPAPAASVPVGNPASTPPGAMPGTIR